MDEDQITLPYEFASADAIPAGFEKAYKVGDDGKARLRMSIDGAEVSNLGGLRRAHEETAGKLSKRGEEMRALEEKLARYQDESGELLDPDTVKAALGKIRSGKVKDQDDVDAMLAKVRKEEQERAAGQIKEGRTTIGELHEQIAQIKISNAAAHACAGTSADPELVEMVVKNTAQLVRDDNGQMVAVIPGENGNPRLSNIEGREGQNMTVEEYVKHILPIEKPNLFPSKAAGGAPSGSGGGNGNGGNRYAGLRAGAKMRAGMRDQAKRNAGR